MLLKKFIQCESGAVTTDYVMLSAAVMSTGVAVADSTGEGVANIANDLDATLRGDIINDSFTRTSYFDDFESSAGYWVGGVQDDTDAYYGGILGPFGGSNGTEVATRTYDLASGYDFATISFDVHAFDSWDNEQFITFVNGEPVSATQFNWTQDGITGNWATTDGRYTITVEPNGSRSHSGYSSSWTDQSATVTIQVANPGPSLTLGYGSTTNQSASDESYGIDNVSVTSTNEAL